MQGTVGCSSDEPPKPPEEQTDVSLPETESTPDTALPVEIEDNISALNASPIPTKLVDEIVEIAPNSPLSTPPTAALPAGIDPIPGSEVVVTTALADLVKQIGPTPEIKLVSIEAVEWSDSSLGCPQEGFMYAQVITPGYLLLFEVDGVQYKYHTDTMKNVVLCKD